jgi:hypothetical protein
VSGSDATVVLAIVVTLLVALHLAAIIDVALMPAWAWRGAADAPKRRWIVQLALLPGWAVVYYRSADRREVRAHLFRCGGVEPDWHADCDPGTRVVSPVGNTLATIKHRRLIREVVEQGTTGGPAPAPAPPRVPSRALAAGALPPIHWQAPAAPPAQLGPGDRIVALSAPGSTLAPIRWYADEWMPRELPAAKRHLRLTA